MRVFLLGSTGTIGRATLRALIARGHEVVCFGRADARRPAVAQDGASFRTGNVTDPASVANDGLRNEPFDAVVSCMASRTGAPQDAWAIDHLAHRYVLEGARSAGVHTFVLLSAICVQKPRLVFQHAKLAFERELVASGIDYSIVRATAYFKSLSGQVERVRQGKPFVVFGDGTLTACKPISDEDLADYLADCLSDGTRRNRILPIGGPGKAITPREQGERLFELFGRKPRYRHVPVALLDTIAGALAAGAHILPLLGAKAEFARIGRYYATESMLVWDEDAGRYDAAATPSTGTRTLFEYYAALASGEQVVERGEHAVF